MADTARLQSHFYLEVDGAAAPDDLSRDLEEVRVENSLHLPDVATLVLHDPRLSWIDDARLEPGKTLRISARGETGEKPLFDGEIVEVEPVFGRSTHRLTVRAFDRLHRLARGRHVRSFLNLTDGDLVRKIAQEVGLQAEVGPANQVHSYLLQANETNLELLQHRAAALGYLLFVREKKLCLQPPQPAGVPIELQWGASLLEFRPRLATADQVTAVTVRGWDPDRRQELIGQVTNGTAAPQVGEKRSGGELCQEGFRLAAPLLVADRPVRTQSEADWLAQAAADRRSGRFIEAEGVCRGNPSLVAGVTVQISALGDRFSGTYFVTGATHVYHVDAGYTTEFGISGHHPSGLLGLLREEQEAAPATALLIGIVTDNQDPGGQGRVKVRFPALSPDHASNWARVVVPGGGPERGIQFLPEVNDEVLVGFELNDIHQPYILGGLWNGVDLPPRKSDQVVSGGEVSQRIIRSRTGHTLTFDDSEGGGGITIEDPHGNRFFLDTAADSLSIQVKGDVEIRADGSLTLEAAGSVVVKGAMIDLN